MNITASYNSRPRYQSDIVVSREGFYSVVAYLFPVRGDGLFEIVRKVIFFGALVCLVIFGGQAGLDLAENYFSANKLRDIVDKTKNPRDWADYTPEEKEIAEEVIRNTQKGEQQMLSKFLLLYPENNDLIGRIKINNSKIDYTVYQGTDNDYYLNHSPVGTKSKFGSIFMDFRNNIDRSEDNFPRLYTLYGHNFFTGDYFSQVSHYWRDGLSFYKEHPVIEFDTLYEEGLWKVFAVVLYNTDEKYGEIYPYTDTNTFYSSEQFETYVTDVMDRSIIYTDVDLMYGDDLLVMSTCYYPYSPPMDEVTRATVYARKVRYGETNAVNVDAATKAPYYYGFNWQAKNRTGYGEGAAWNGGAWDKAKYLIKQD